VILVSYSGSGWERNDLQVVCISIDFSLFWVIILTSDDAILQTYERRIILLYFAAKTLQHQLPLCGGHVP
jgi:hypothetical protein